MASETVKNLVVLLIDMQNDFIDSPEKRNLIPNQISVLKACYDKGIPVITIEYANHGKIDEKLSEVIKNIPNNNRKKIIKSFDNAFIGTSLDILLKELNAKKLLIMGVNACACVYSTAIGAKERGYEIITSEDLIAGYCSSHCFDTRAGWYDKNTTYTKDHNHIIQELNFGGAVLQ